MNYDMNDGTPPYDMPFDGLPIDDSSNTPSGAPNEGDFSIPADDFSMSADIELPGDVELPSDDVSFQEEDVSESANISENDGDFASQRIVDEGLATENNDSPEAYAPAPKKKGPKVLLPILILVMGLLVAGSLYAFYGADLNFDFSNKTSNNNIAQDNESSDMTSEENENDGEQDLTQSEGAEENNDMAMNGEGTESIDIDIAKNRIQRGNLQGEDNGMPPIPGAGVNQGPMQNGFNDASSQNQMASAQRPNYGTYGRLDPFNPANSSGQLFDVLMPPSNPAPDTDAQQLMTLKISGIMYTPDSPSAIINIAGSDQLVRTGDKFNGFSVTGITKDKVTVKNGSNSYTASVGEYLNLEAVGVNAIPNLNKKFAGPYSKGNGRIIEINTLN